MSRPVYIIKLESPRGDSIKNLRFVLKRLGRTFGFRCLSAIEISASTQKSPPDDSGNMAS